MVNKAWSFKAIEQDDLRYYGNNGYEDDSSKHYRYDNLVANHKNVKVGDLVIITNRNEVIGISIIENISSKPALKMRNKCPSPGCTAKKLRPRKTLKPVWLCSNGHPFNKPLVIEEPITEFTAEYSREFIRLNNLSMNELKENTPRYNVQSSIQEVDFEWAKNLIGKHPKSNVILEGIDADDNYIRNDEDARKLVQRAIKQRRGQKNFRNMLLASMAVCAVTGCTLVDILEAAHIDAYRNDNHNNIKNGILLRSDIHTLFDLHLLAINPITLTVHLAESIDDVYYKKYNGMKLNIGHELSIEALNARWEIFNS